MKFCRTAVLAGLLLVTQPGPSMAETVRLKSGREVEIIDGKIAEEVAGELYREAEGLLKKGRLDLASEYWQLLVEKGRGSAVSQAKATQEKIRKIEYESLILLRNGNVFRGRISVDLRTDLLGLEGKGAIPLWQLEEIVAEYHPGYSQVSKTFYPLTVLEIRFRGGELKTARITREIEFLVEGVDGSVARAVLGKEYEILRSTDLARQLDGMVNDRITKIVIYPGLERPE
ncbi:MAG: hypothetical protein HY694_00780 [Deltaproteobacteria bacterium]|nr:hypothetical protein [Deltaproteobacteria bacterium]